MSLESKKKGKIKKSLVVIEMYGLILSESYQRCKLFARKLRKCYKKTFQEPFFKGFLEMDWLEHLNKLQKDIGGQSWAIKHGVVIFVDKVFIGGESELFSKFKNYVYLYKNSSAESIKNSAKEEYQAYLNRNNLLYTYFELSLDSTYMGTLLFQLRPDLLPKSSAWFGMLCQANNKFGYSFKGSKVTRICRSGWFQAGETYLPQDMTLEDESYCYKHDRRGILSFANDGRGTNQSQFFVTFKPSAWMDQYYVSFGRVVEGFDVLRRIEHTECIYESPCKEITISDCGMAEVGLGKTLKETFKLRIRGLTVGMPHVDLNMYMDIILDRLCDVLFERLDQEIKDRIQGEWLANVLWDKVQEQLMEKQPVADVIDVKDRSSQKFLTSHYLAGLYSLQDVPDRYIQELINTVINDAVERSDTINMAESVVRYILDIVYDPQRKAVEAQKVAGSIMSLLIDHVTNIAHGSLISLYGSGTSEDWFPRRPTRDLLVEVKPKLVKIEKQKEDILAERHLDKLSQEISSLSSKGSLRLFMMDLLANSLMNAISTEQFKI